MNLKTFSQLVSLALLTAAPVASAQVVTNTINFDSISSGAPANTATPPSVSFVVGQFSPELDGFGDPILGTDRWRADTNAPAVLVRDPNFYGRGNAPSPVNALDAVFDPTLMIFDAPQSLLEFSVTLDLDTFGTPGLTIDLFATGPTNDTLIASIPINQTIAGFTATLSAPAIGVDKILLPAGALYDNFVYAVPEPSTYALMVTGGLGALAFRLRRRK